MLGLLVAVLLQMQQVCTRCVTNATGVRKDNECLKREQEHDDVFMPRISFSREFPVIMTEAIFV